MKRFKKDYPNGNKSTNLKIIKQLIKQFSFKYLKNSKIITALVKNKLYLGKMKNIENSRMFKK